MNWKEYLEKKSLNQGDFVKVESDGITVKGYIIPSENDDFLVLKLTTGYNVGFKLDKIENITKLDLHAKVSKPPTKKIPFDENKPTILILHTGGTIASRVNYKTGGVYASFGPEDLLTMFPELADLANFKCDLVYGEGKMSEDLSFEDIGFLAEKIKEKISKENIRGIIIGHGTDTIAYNSAILSFMLENLKIPILFVGAQRSTDRGSTDAAMNLVCASEFIIKTDYCGVGLCMHESTNDDNCIILPGTKARKMHTSRRDAFKVVNDLPIARINYKTKKIEYLKEDYPKKNDKEFKVLSKMENKVALVKAYPNMTSEIFKFYKDQGYKGILLEGTGLGHITEGDADKDANKKALKELIDGGCVSALASQCIFGRANPYVYTNLRKLEATGIIFCEDMHPETAFVKLAWLLGNYSEKEAKEMLTKNLRGEISIWSKINTFPK